jgi:hypothetical protein
MSKVKNRSDELKVQREQLQKKIFCRWVNFHLTSGGKIPISNLDNGFHSGVALIDLSEVLSEKRVKSKWSKKPRNRIQMLENLSIALSFLQKKCKLKLVGIGNRSIFDGDTTLTLGLVWSMILHFQVDSIVVNESGETEREEKKIEEGEEKVETPEEEIPKPQKPQKTVSGKKALLLWAKAHTKAELTELNHDLVKNLHKSWKDGYAFCALVNHFRPDLMDMQEIRELPSDRSRLEKAFEVCTNDLGLPALLDADDLLLGPKPDEKAVTTYLAELFKLFSKAVPVVIPKKPPTPPPTPVPEKKKIIRKKRDARNVPTKRDPSDAIRRECRRIDRHNNAAKSATSTAMVVDLGTSTLRVGFSGDEAPRAEDPVIIGRPFLPCLPELGVGALGFQIDDENKNDEDEEDDDDDVVVGTAAVMTSSRGVYRLTTPMSRGIVTNWVDMERIWYIFFS